MPFQIQALDYEPFAPLFAMPDDELAARHARRVTVAESPATPCRVSLRDAAVGERVVLVHYRHQPAASPYRASHAIFVRESAVRARPAPGEVPPVLSTRLLSVRLFDADHMMVDADVLDGVRLADRLEAAFADPAVAYAHIHNARPGCFAARAERAA